MDNIKIGPAFGAELAKAGLSGINVAWGCDGELSFGDGVTADQIAAVKLVLASHDPSSGASNATILAQIAALDVYIPRGLEDTWTALGFDITKLPVVQQDRLTQKRALRAQLVG